MEFNFIEIYLKNSNIIKKIYTKNQLIGEYKKLIKRDIKKVIVYFSDGTKKQYNSSLSIDFVVRAINDSIKGKGV